MKIYFVGICGVMMAPIAVAMRDQGHEVSGSDKGFYPPISTYLNNRQIPMLAGYKREHITKDIDIAVISSAIGEKNVEYQQLKELGIKCYLGYASFLQDYLIKKNSIVCVGTYGKTTITAFIAYMLEVAGYDPSFAIGGIPMNFPDGVCITDGEYSVVEGDEYIDSRLTEKQTPKFMFYHPRILILSAAKYDHLDVYPNVSSYMQSYRDCIAQMSEGSLIIANRDGENIREVLAGFEDRYSIIYTSAKEGDTYAKLLSIPSTGNGRSFEVEHNGHAYIFTTPLLGDHNIRNLLMGIALGFYMGIQLENIQEAVSNFTGVKRRLEIRKTGPYMVIDDLAHSPIKAQSSIDAVKQAYPDKKLTVVFEPHTLSSRLRSSLPLYSGYFTHADTVLIAPVYHEHAVDEQERVSSTDIAMQIGSNAQGFSSFNELKTYLEKAMQPGDILLFMSSGNIGGLVDYFSL